MTGLDAATALKRLLTDEELKRRIELQWWYFMCLKYPTLFLHRQDV